MGLGSLKVNLFSKKLFGAKLNGFVFRLPKRERRCLGRLKHIPTHFQAAHPKGSLKPLHPPSQNITIPHPTILQTPHPAVQQTAFDFNDPAYPRFDKMLGNANAELIYILQQEHDQFLYIWGEQGSGKSHILQAWVGQALQNRQTAVYIDAGTTPLTDSAVQADFVAIDQIEKLNDAEQATLFYIFNHFRNSKHGHLLLSADTPPSKLQLREDLRTRMGYCLVYDIKPLSDEEKIDALVGMAGARQLALEPEIFRYLLTYWRRDMDSLVQMLDTLCHYAATTRRRITLPLLRQLLKQQDTP